MNLLWLLLIDILLQFDGSCRPPRDTGFPLTASRLASCAAAIISDDGNVVALGGKTLPMMPGMTSADAEFEGLLLGLDFLLDSKNEDEMKKDLIIEGDCKPIIDQLNNKSIARKLETKYDRAQKNLLEFESVEVRHIPRRQNQLTDAVCGKAIELLTEQRIHLLCEKAKNSSFDEKQSFKKLENIVSVLSDCVDEICRDSSIVPHSKRLDLFNMIQEKAVLLNDGLALIKTGQAMADEAGIWPSLNDATDEVTKKEHLLAESAVLQIHGYSLLGKAKDTKKVERKYRFILENYRDRLKWPLLKCQTWSALDLPEKQNYEALSSWEKQASQIFLSSDQSFRTKSQKIWTEHR